MNLNIQINDERVSELVSRGMEELDRETFMKSITPECVNVDQDGSVEFAFDDADIFAGHTILVQMDPDGEFEEAYIAG